MTKAALYDQDFLEWTQQQPDYLRTGLRVESVFRSFIVTLPPSANLVSIGQLSERDWQGVRSCVKVALAELNEPTSLLE